MSERASQYYNGDEEEALALARLIADIEPKRREDAMLVLARAFDCGKQTGVDGSDWLLSFFRLRIRNGV